MKWTRLRTTRSVPTIDCIRRILRRRDMSGQQSEQLLGYLLGALEEGEHRQIEAQLRHDPSLRAELARLRQCLEPLENSWRPVCPPAGLWQRACHFVDVASRVVPGALAQGGLARPGRWSLRDPGA